MSGVGKLSDDVRRRRWQSIVHIMRKEPDNDCRTALTCMDTGRAPKAKGDPRPHRGAQWRRREVEPDGDHGMMCGY